MSLFQIICVHKKVALVSALTLVSIVAGTVQSHGQVGGFVGQGGSMAQGGFVTQGGFTDRDGGYVAQGGSGQSQAQTQTQARSQRVVLRPVDTGRKVVTFSLSMPKPDLGRLAVKTNLLYAAGTLTPNLSLEVATGGHTSLEVTAGYNKWGNLWDFSATGPDWDPGNVYKRKLDHVLGKAEFRYWLRGSFDGHFFGAYGLWADYHTGELGMKPVLEKRVDYDGYLYGGGLTYGYLWKLNRRCGVELSVGAGVVGTRHDERGIEVKDGEYSPLEAVKWQKSYLGPTSVGVKFVLMIL